MMAIAKTSGVSNTRANVFLFLMIFSNSNVAQRFRERVCHIMHEKKGTAELSGSALSYAHTVMTSTHFDGENRTMTDCAMASLYY